MEPLRIRLEAVNPARNCYRTYSIRVDRDLFGYWLVEVTNGRIGARGSSRFYATDADDVVRRIIRTSLQRRKSARRRVGVDYAVKEIDGDLAWLSDARISLFKSVAA